MIRYKGGDYERGLCSQVGLKPVNIKFLECLKFPVLQNQFKVNHIECCMQYRGCYFFCKDKKLQSSLHYCHVETISFSFFVLQVKGDESEKLIKQYAWC